MAEPIHVADPYRALGVARSATDAEIKAAHRKLAKRYHPDAGGSDTRRFLRVQEAYRVLSDPLLRREWDARHAPGPVRADRPARAARAPRAARAATDADPAQTPPPRPDARRQPRSSRAYTWSATEVPWWEDVAARDARRRTRRQSAAPGPEPTEEPVADPTEARPQPDAPNEFDVYNRSSGAAWSMAARAYFRRDEQDLPRRGSFHHEGSQPLTAARARTAAEHEARRRAAAAPSRPEPAPAPATVHQARERIIRRALPSAWPSTAQRLTYALIGWVPVAALVVLAGSVAPVGELTVAVLLALSLGVFYAVSKLAYVASVATLGLLVVGAVLIGALAVLGVPLPLSAGMTAALGAALALGYVAVAGMVALGPPSLRPWSRHAQPVRNR